MHTSRRLRRTAAAVATVVVAGLLPLFAASAPAIAAEPCLSEVPPEVLPGVPSGESCDDISPPETTISAVTPSPNDRNFLTVDRVSFTFEARYADADVDPIKYQCQFYATPTTPPDSAWTDCQSPQSYTGLDETGVSPYTFRVRAIDSADNAIDITANPFFPSDADIPDIEATPASDTVRIDTLAPNTFIFNEPFDELRPDLPMVESRNVQLRLDATEGDDENPVKYRCQLNNSSVPCDQGITTLKDLSPGDKRFEVISIDLAGNIDPTPATTKFAVPANLTSPKGKGWRTVRGGGYFGGDFLESQRIGAQVTAPGNNVRELRLIAPSGPNLGKVEVKIGNSIWRTVSLKSKNYERFKIYVIRDQFEPLVSGKIRIRVKSLPEKFSIVRIDAILAH